AGFVFGLFGTFTSSATLSINSSTVVCTVPLAGVGTCTMTVDNTGSGATSLNGAGPAAGTFIVALHAGAVPIPANSLTSVLVDYTGTAVAGQTVSGFLS